MRNILMRNGILSPHAKKTLNIDLNKIKTITIEDNDIE